MKLHEKNMEIIQMSQKELKRGEIIVKIMEGALNTKKASYMLKL